MVSPVACFGEWDYKNEGHEQAKPLIFLARSQGHKDRLSFIDVTLDVQW